MSRRRAPSQAPHILLCGQAANEGAEREAGRGQPCTQRTDHVTHLQRYLPRRRHHQHLSLTAEHKAREQHASFMYMYFHDSMLSEAFQVPPKSRHLKPH